MKTIIGLILLPAVVMAGGTANNASIVADNPLNHVSFAPQVVAPTITVADPLRKFGDRVVLLRGADAPDGLDAFSGTVVEVQPSGIRINGSYTGSGLIEFFVKNFPYEVAENETIGGGTKTYIAAEAGVYTYTTVAGSSWTIRCLNYGTVYVPPPPTPEQIEAAKAKAEAEKIATQKKCDEALATALKHDRDQAAAGDMIALQNMGDRYRDGRGVDMDLAKAREYLQKAVDAGNTLAADDLKALPPSGDKQETVAMHSSEK